MYSLSRQVDVSFFSFSNICSNLRVQYFINTKEGNRDWINCLDRGFGIAGILGKKRKRIPLGKENKRYWQCSYVHEYASPIKKYSTYLSLVTGCSFLVRNCLNLPSHRGTCLKENKKLKKKKNEKVELRDNIPRRFFFSPSFPPSELSLLITWLTSCLITCCMIERRESSVRIVFINSSIKLVNSIR